MWGSGGDSRLGCYSNQNLPCESFVNELMLCGTSLKSMRSFRRVTAVVGCYCFMSCSTLLSLGVCVVAFVPHCHPVHFLPCLSVNFSLPPYSNFSLKALLSTTRQVTLPQDTSALPLPHIPVMTAHPMC